MEAATATTIASLPHALLARVLARLPVDARLRCSEVCRGWRHVLARERDLWTVLDLSRSSGVTHEVTDALLRAAASKAGGALVTLDVTYCYEISHEALLEVVTANAGSLLQLRAAALEGGACTCEQAEALLRAAPRLRELVANVQSNADDAARMLRKEAVFQPLRVSALCVYAHGADGAALHALAAALAVHATPLAGLTLRDTPLGAPDVLDALVDAALANRLAEMAFSECGLSPASAPSLARLLGSGALTSLYIADDDVQLLDAPAAALLGGALRANTVLQSLVLIDVGLWHDACCCAAATLMASLAAHPILRRLTVSSNAVDPAHSACAGAAFFTLVSANAPSLQELTISHCHLGDAGLRLLMDALRRNTHLKALRCLGNDMSEEFARDVLLPAVRANASLTLLLTFERHAGAVEAEAIARRRCAASS
jgi:hypothetical protein